MQIVRVLKVNYAAEKMEKKSNTIKEILRVKDVLRSVH